MSVGHAKKKKNKKPYKALCHLYWMLKKILYMIYGNHCDSEDSILKWI